MADVTRILNAIERGDAKATEKLLLLVYEELRILAAQKMAQEKPGQTLQATALVHEAYLRLVGADSQDWTSRGHFFGAAAEAMRRILIDSARRKQSQKRGQGHKRIEFDEDHIAFEAPATDMIALNEALTELEKTDQNKAELVKLCYFAGLTLEQAAAAMDISHSTAKRRWRYARAWLFKRLHPADQRP